MATVTTTLFRVPQCADLGEDSYHEDDFTVDCSSGSFYTAVSFALLLIAVVPIGVPLCFLWLMARAKSALPDGKANTTVLGGTKLCSDDMDDDQDRYGFLCRDLKPEYWYYESECSNCNITTAIATASLPRVPLDLGLH